MIETRGSWHGAHSTRSARAVTLEFRLAAHSGANGKNSQEKGQHVGKKPFPIVMLAQVTWKMWTYFFGVSRCLRQECQMATGVPPFPVSSRSHGPEAPLPVPPAAMVL